MPSHGKHDTKKKVIESARSIKGLLKELGTPYAGMDTTAVARIISLNDQYKRASEEPKGSARGRVISAGLVEAEKIIKDANFEIGLLIKHPEEISDPKLKKMLTDPDIVNKIKRRMIR